MRKTILMASACLMLAACVTRTVGPDPMAGVGSSLAVERFLQAANARDLAAKSRVFGTADRQEVELQMNLVSQILQHEDYRVVSENPVPGRIDPTTRIGVDLVRAGGQQAVDVGFLVVLECGDGSWLVQEIELDKITG